MFSCQSGFSSGAPASSYDQKACIKMKCPKMPLVCITVCQPYDELTTCIPSPAPDNEPVNWFQLFYSFKSDNLHIQEYRSQNRELSCQ